LARQSHHGRFILERSGSDSCIGGLHKIQNDVKDRLIADRSIDHRVVNGAIRPFDVKLLLDEIGAPLINGIHELLGFFLALSGSQQAPDLVLSRSVKKHAQRVLAILEKLLRSPSDDDRVPGFRRV
jgi:hypothetical protein